MGFLVPAFLAGLAAVVVPIVLHLRHRDKDTPHRFPSLMFVERLPIRTAQRRRITDWPLLLLRALAIILLVVAFARPLWWKPALVNASAPPKTMVLVLDRSASMSHRAVWTAAQDSVRHIVQSLGAEDRAALVLFDDQAEVAQPLTTDKALLMAAVAKATPGVAGTRYASGLRAARQIAIDANTRTAPVDVAVISDFQRNGTAGLAGLDLPTSLHVRPVAVSSGARANTSVAVAEARPIGDSARQRLAVAATIRSRGVPAARQMSVGLRLNGRPTGTKLVTVAGEGETRVVFDPVPLPSGLVRGELTIDPDSLAADDTARFTRTSNDAVKVLLVAPDDADRDETLYIERALAVGRSPSVQLERLRPGGIDAGRLEDAALVILWDVAPPSGSAGAALQQWTARGGGVVQVAARRTARRFGSPSLLPATASGLADRSDDRGGSLGDVRLDHPLLAPFRQTPAALAAPRFLRHARLQPAHGGEIVARFDDGSAAVVERTDGMGHVIMVGMPLDARAGDFPLQPAYLPFVRQLVLYATRRDATPLAREAGESWLMPASAREPVVSTPDGSIIRPPRDTRAASVPLREAGIYTLHDGETRSAPVGELAVNVPASESDLGVVATGDLLADVRRSGASVGDADPTPAPIEIERRQGLWRLAILAFVALLLAEMLMASRGWRAVANPMTKVPSSGESA